MFRNLIRYPRKPISKSRNVVNSAKYERNSKKELIGRLSQEISEDGGTDAPDNGSPCEGFNEESPAMPVSSPNKISTSLPEVKNGVRIVPEDPPSRKEEQKSRGVPGRVRKFAVSIVIILTLAGAGIVFWNYIQDRSNDDGRNYLGPLPAANRDVSTLPEILVPTAVCTRSSDIMTEIGAEAYYAVFTDSFSVAYAQFPYQKAPFASIVKLLGGIVIAEEYDLDAAIALKEKVDAEGNGIDLEVGEMVLTKHLLGAALVGSKNDAMYALAQNYPGGTEAFVVSLNEKAAEIGMKDTSITNPIGLDDPEQYSTPRDIALLMIVAMRYPIIAEITGSSSYTVVTEDGRQEIVRTTNSLLDDVPGVIGGKTGYTAEAGFSLVAYVHDSPDFVTVVFNAEDRYEASRLLIEAVRDGYSCM